MFERLTFRDSLGVACYKWELPSRTEVIANEAITRLAEYEDSGLTPEEVQELAKAKADGRLVVLPVKVGDTVYWRSPFGSVASGKVSGMRLTKHFGIDLQIESEEKPNSSVWREMEKVFLTREAAEKALAEVVGE